MGDRVVALIMVARARTNAATSGTLTKTRLKNRDLAYPKIRYSGTVTVEVVTPPES